MAYSGEIRFIAETQVVALVKSEAKVGYDAESEGEHRILKADFSSKNRGDVIHYTYNAPSTLNDGHDVVLS